MTTIRTDGGIRITTYRREYAADFARLNLQWLEGYALIEDLDRKYLADPETHVLAGGGQIFFAVENRDVIGTFAALRQSRGEFGLAELAVAPIAQGRGLGRQLAEAALSFAQAAGAEKVTLVSSTKLVAAVRLYESLGFQHTPMPADVVYETADVYMELRLP